jgi:hypothetical protein
MLLILVSWLLSSIVFVALGCGLKRLLKLPRLHSLYLLINGMFVYTLLIWSVLYFTGFSLYFQLAITILSVIYLIFNKNNCPELSDTKKYLWHLSKFQKIYYTVLLLVLLALTSATPLLPDNESYYIQTVKWANEQGFVAGLMNIHPFLGQFSAWHILQAGTNFHNPFFTLNDLNAYFIFIFLLFFPAIKQKSTWLLLFPSILIFLLPFAGNPSPDLPVILLSLLTFDLFMRNYSKPDKNELMQLLLIGIFSLTIKLTAVMNLILLLIIAIRQAKFFKKNISVYISGILILFLWISKNYLITGYLFYPLQIAKNTVKPVWQYPGTILNFLNETGGKESMAINLNKDVLQQFSAWLFQDDITHKIMNPLMILLLILAPAIWFFKAKRTGLTTEKIIYFTGLTYVVFLLFFNPNFRFYLAFLLWLILFIFDKIFKPYIKTFNTFGIIIFMAGSFIFAVKNGFQAEKNLWMPQAVSKLNYRFKQQKTGNFEYHYPDDDRLFWETGNAPLPAAHHNMIKYFDDHFGYKPEKINNNTYINRSK